MTQYTPTLREVEFWFKFNECYNFDNFGKLSSAFWKTYHEVTM